MTQDPDPPNLDDGVEAPGPVVPTTFNDPEARQVPIAPVSGVESLGFTNPGTDEPLRANSEAQAEELARLRRRASELEASYKRALRERELATALAGRPLVPGAAAQLIKLWGDDLDVYEEEGAYKVASRDGRPVAEAVADWLAGPDYAHFCRPTSRGGTSPPGTNRSAAEAPAPARPLSLGEAILSRWRDSIAQRPDASSLPRGLGRNRFS